MWSSEHVSWYIQHLSRCTFFFNSLCTSSFECPSAPQWRSFIFWTLTSVLHTTFPVLLKIINHKSAPKIVEDNADTSLVPKFITVKAKRYNPQTLIIQGKISACFGDISWLLFLPPGVCQRWKQNPTEDQELLPINVALFCRCSCSKAMIHDTDDSWVRDMKRFILLQSNFL